MLQPRTLLVLAALLSTFVGVFMKDGATIEPGGKPNLAGPRHGGDTGHDHEALRGQQG